MKLNIGTGQRFGKLMVVTEVDRLRLPSGQTNRAFLCKCDCGKESVVRLLHLVRGRIRSCGCLGGEQHGMSNKHPLYTVWRGMKYRCYGDKTIQPHLYKDRGIRVCDEWKESFIAFYEWGLSHGWAVGLTIDRINGDGNYEPSNCRFVTPFENNLNRRITKVIEYAGNRIELSRLIRDRGLQKHEGAIRARLYKGWDAERAIDAPIRQGNYRRVL